MQIRTVVVDPRLTSGSLYFEARSSAENRAGELDSEDFVAAAMTLMDGIPIGATSPQTPLIHCD